MREQGGPFLPWHLFLHSFQIARPTPAHARWASSCVSSGTSSVAAPKSNLYHLDPCSTDCFCANLQMHKRTKVQGRDFLGCTTLPGSRKDELTPGPVLRI